MKLTRISIVFLCIAGSSLVALNRPLAFSVVQVQSDSAVIKITLHNDSKRTVSILKHDPVSDYSISIQTSDRHPIPFTVQGKRAYARPTGPTIERTIAVDLGPNESTTDTLDLATYFEISPTPNTGLRSPRSYRKRRIGIRRPRSFCKQPPR